MWIRGEGDVQRRGMGRGGDVMEGLGSEGTKATRLADKTQAAGQGREVTGGRTQQMKQRLIMEVRRLCGA